MASPYERRIQSILKQYATPILQENGFSRDRSRYYRQLSELMWLVEIQRSSFNDSTEASFTISCGIFVPGFVPRYLGMKEPIRPQCPDCPICTRIGFLSEDRINQWWTMSILDEPSTVDPSIGGDLARRLESDCMSFFKRFQTRRDVLNYLLDYREQRGGEVTWPSSRLWALVFACIMSQLLGDACQSHALWEQAVQTAAGGPSESAMPIIRGRIFGD
jgi:hypothetical protein